MSELGDRIKQRLLLLPHIRCIKESARRELHQDIRKEVADVLRMIADSEDIDPHALMSHGDPRVTKIGSGEDSPRAITMRLIRALADEVEDRHRSRLSSW